MSDNLMPMVAPPNTRGVPRIVVPSGIGDVYWVMVKLESFLKHHKIDVKPEIVLLVDNTAWESSQLRSVPFLEMIPFVSLGDPITVLQDPVKPRPKCLQDIYVEVGRLRGRTVFPGFMGFEYFICYNGVINSGHYIEKNDALECNWYLPLTISEEQEQFMVECRENHGRYAVFYFSLVGDFITHNLTQFSLPKLAKGINMFAEKTGVTPVFIGAYWDLRWPREGQYPQYLAQLIGAIPGAVNLVGQTSLDQAFGAMRGAELVAGYHCGLTNMALMFKKKSVLLWAPNRFPPATCFAVAPPETRKTTYFPLWTKDLSVDKFANTMIELVR